MIKAQIQFLQNSHIADLSQLPIVLREDLQQMGILTPQDLIRLDNARTLKIELYPENNRGERILDLVNKKSDTLGAVNRLCYTLRCMDVRDVTKFFENLDNGDYDTLSDAQHGADKLRGQRKIANKKNEHYR
ncbi:MAG: hypothetical protein Q3Y24_02340 [Clostridia bacterium]|jgi:hypothetical protein|nr:hypothetical protein [Clostridia bacterium]